MDPRPAPRRGIPPIFTLLLLQCSAVRKGNEQVFAASTETTFEKSNRLMGLPAPSTNPPRTLESSGKTRLYDARLVGRSSCPHNEDVAECNLRNFGGRGFENREVCGRRNSWFCASAEMHLAAEHPRKGGAMMEENGVEDISQLGGSGGTIQLALDALKEKKGSVDQVRA